MTRNLVDARWVFARCSKKLSDGFICRHRNPDFSGGTKVTKGQNIYNNKLIECGQTHVIVENACFTVHYKHRNETVKDMHNKCITSNATLVIYNVTLYKKLSATFTKWNAYQLYPDKYVTITNYETNQCVLLTQRDTKWWKIYKWHVHEVPCNKTQGIYLCATEPISNEQSISCELHHEFQCSDLTCISHLYLCDGISDCSDGEDEAEYQCKCLKRTGKNQLCRKICNENDCNCSLLYFQCQNRDCLLYLFICDGEQNCRYGEDELCGDNILNVVNITIPFVNLNMSDLSGYFFFALNLECPYKKN